MAQNSGRLKPTTRLCISVTGTGRSALGDLEEGSAVQSSFMRRPTSMEPWFAWKNTLRAEHGLTIGVSWGLLWQSDSSSRIDQNNAVGSKFTFNLAMPSPTGDNLTP